MTSLKYPRPLVSLLLVASFASGLALPRVARAEDAQPDGSTPPPAAVEEAGRRYDRGLKFYSEGEYRLAVIEFERTYELVPDYRVLYNIGQVRIQLGDYARARKALERYMSEGQDKIKADRAQAVKNDLDMLEGRTATLKIAANPEGVEVLVDGESVGVTPLADAILLNAGDHNVELRKVGFRPQVVRRTLAGSDAATLDAKLEPVPAAAPAAVAPERPFVASTPRSTTPMWIGWSVTAGLAAGAIATGFLGNKAADDLDAARNQRDVSSADLKSDSNRAKMLLITSDALAAAAVVAGGVSLYLTLRSPAHAEPTRDSASLGLRFSPGGVRLVGSY